MGKISKKKGKNDKKLTKIKITKNKKTIRKTHYL